MCFSLGTPVFRFGQWGELDKKLRHTTVSEKVWAGAHRFTVRRWRYPCYSRFVDEPECARVDTAVL